MRREVPDHADVLLVQAEVDALGGDEVDVAQLAGVDDLLDLAHGRAEDEGVADHEREPLRAASSTSSQASAVSAVMGFSTKTCLPAEHGLGEGKCVEMGVATSTASTAASASTSARSAVTATAG